MKFLSIDQHISVCTDVRYIFNNLGHTVTELSLSGHASIIGKEQIHIDMLSGDQWGVTIRERKFKEFTDRYHKTLDQFDGFICCYPPIFSMLYKHLDKPIIIQIPIRYECGAENHPDLWEEFNTFLRDGIDSGKIILTANSMYDKMYAELFLQRYVDYIPSLCKYTGISYNPTRELFLYYHNVKLNDPSGRMIKKHDALKAGHAWQCIGDFRGCIHYPYNVSTMSTFEQYTANIPIFFPEKQTLLNMWRNDEKVLTQISWLQQIPGMKSGTQINFDCDIHGKPDPNLFDDIDSLEYWLNYSDFYYMNNDDSIKYIQLFKDVNDVLSLSNHDLLTISQAMREHNIDREKVIYQKWQNVLKRL